MKLITENQLVALVRSIASKLENLSDKDATTASQITSLQTSVTTAQNTANSATTKANNAQATANDALSRANTATGTPSQITATSTNGVTTTSHTHAIDKASTTVAGVVQLNDTLASTATNQALTANQGRVLYDSKLDKNASAVSASRLVTARQIALTGAVTGSVSFNGSAHVSIATTLNLTDFANSKTENGYQKLPGGLIIQWGQHIVSTNPGESSININFPIGFPNRCLNVSATRRMSQHSTAGDGGVLIVSTTTTSAVFSMQTFSTSVADLRGFDWIAIGY